MIPNCTFNRPKWKIPNTLQNNRDKTYTLSKNGKPVFDKIVFFFILFKSEQNRIPT